MARSVKIFGAKLRAARDAAFLTQTQLGEKLDPKMSDENIGRIERLKVAGIMSKQIPHLAAALKIPLDVFMRDFVDHSAGREKGATEVKQTREQKLDAIRQLVAASGIPVAEVVKALQVRRVGSIGRPAPIPNTHDTPEKQLRQ